MTHTTVLTGGNTPATSLQSFEEIIDRGLATFVEVGKALSEILKAKLYEQAGFATFEVYCKERWGWGQRQAYNYMEASEVSDNLHSNAKTKPSLTQAVHLAGLPVGQQREVVSTLETKAKGLAGTSTRELKEIVREVKSGTVPAMAVLPPAMRLTVPDRKSVWACQMRKNFEKELIRLIKSYEKANPPIEAIIVKRNNGIPTGIDIAQSASEATA